MNGAHVHLLINHFPVMGMAFGALVLTWALWTKNQGMQKFALGFFVLVGLGTGLAYLSGEGAEEVVEHLAGISEEAIERHEEAAVWVLVTAGLSTLLSLVGLIKADLTRSSWYNKALYFLIAMSLILAGWVSNLGAKILHHEI